MWGVMRRTLDFSRPLPAGWSELSPEDSSRAWSRFAERFGGLRPSIGPVEWPAIREPTPSVTFDLSVATATPGLWAARGDAINAEALRCFLTAFDDPEWVVLDWQHPSYQLDAAVHAATEDTEWRVSVYPNGDYYTFARPDFSEGTFGHPWERTLCVFGPRLVETLGHTLSTWLPRTRVDGQPVD